MSLRYPLSLEATFMQLFISGLGSTSDRLNIPNTQSVLIRSGDPVRRARRKQHGTI
jgi:hypothetical protein